MDYELSVTCHPPSIADDEIKTMNPKENQPLYVIYTGLHISLKLCNRTQTCIDHKLTLEIICFVTYMFTLLSRAVHIVFMFCTGVKEGNICIPS